MQPDTIFCPQCNTLILDQPACPQCDWEREPAPTETTGGIAWRQEATAKVCTDLTLAGDLLLFGTEDGVIHAWDVSSGEERWPFPLPEGWVPAQWIAAAEDRVFVTADDLRPLGSHDKALFALRVADGHELWRHDTSALRLSPPLLHEDTVYFAASDRGFHAVDAQSGKRRWRVTIPGWSRSAPAASDDPSGRASGRGLVYFSTQAGPTGPRLIIALRVDDGAEAWPPVPCDNTIQGLAIAGDDLYAASWDGTLYRLDARTGERRWPDLPIGTRILTPPVLHDRFIFFGARDRHLYAVDRESGEVVRRFPTEGKVRAAPVVSAGVLYVAASQRPERVGRIYALNAETREPLWPEPMDVEDRVEYAPASDGHRLYVATRHGLVWGITIHERASADAPQTYQEQGDLERAAIAYALQGDYAQAGQLYAELDEPHKAGELYHKAGEVAPDAEARQAAWQRAGELYEQAQAWGKARATYQDLGLPIRVACILEKQERWAEAAAWFERAGSPAQAAEMYERAEQWEKAAQMYEQAGDIESARRCRERLGDRDKLARWLVTQNLLDQAAAEYEKLGDLARAAELYKEAGRLAEAAALYKQIQAWDQARELYQRLGDGVEEAGCCEALMEWEEAGRLYEAAAQELEDTAPPDEVRLADLYDRAAVCYQRIFRRQQQAACWQKVIRYRHLPEVELEVEQQEPFVLGEKNVLLVMVKNVGFGIASAIRLRVREGDFEGELARTVPGLAIGDSEPLDFSVKPRVAGRALFEVRLSYQDRWGTPHTREARAHVRVEREPPTTFTPQVIEVKGDWIIGQKGDRVDIQRGQRRIHLEAGEGPEAPDRIEIEGRLPLSVSGEPLPPSLERREEQIPAEEPVCGRCGTRLDLGQLRCPDCGTRYCPICYNPLADLEDLRRCYHCGAELGQEDAV